VIDASTNTVIGSAIPVGSIPLGLAVTPDGRKVYVANFNGNTVSVIDTATTTVTSIPLSEPHDVAVSPDGSKVYVASASGSVFVVNTATNALIGSPISAGLNPLSLAVAPDGSKIYVTNNASNNDTASVIDTAMNAVVATITVGLDPFGVAVTPDGRKVYVVNSIPGTGPGTVSVINTSANRVTAMIPVGVNPAAFGLFIQPARRFAGTPGKANCHGKSVSALAKQYGGLNGAAAALGFDSVKALQIAIDEFCAA
jgi:YVTN family beta-propeller protein